MLPLASLDDHPEFLADLEPDLARGFGQRAIYQWAHDAMNIVGVDEPHCRRLGWSLSGNS